MIFGMFKKNEAADIIFTGGKIYTQSPDAPRAEAVACKDGRILAIGDAEAILNFQGKKTEVVNIDGGVILPGFVDVGGHPVLRAFKDVCLILYGDMSQSQVLEALAGYIENNPGKPGYFAYGYNTELTLNKPAEELHAALDKVCGDKPIALLDVSGTEGWFNTKAMDMVRDSLSEEEDTPVITLSYVLHVLSPIDFDLLQTSVVKLAYEYCKKGYTTVFDCGSPDYLHSIYQEIIVDMLEVDMLKQRFIGSFLITRDISADYILRKLSQKQTSCAEVEDFLSCSTLKLIINNAPGNPGGIKISGDLLKRLAVGASDMGFNIHIDAIGEGSVAEALKAVSIARAAGYKKTHFIIAHSESLNEEEEFEFLHDSGLYESASTLGDFNIKFGGVKGALDADLKLNKVTLSAADILGISDDCGSIENGKLADFVIYRENPLDCNVAVLSALNSYMTVIGGKIVYNSEEDTEKKWQDELRSKQQLLDEQLLQDEYDLDF